MFKVTSYIVIVLLSTYARPDTIGADIIVLGQKVEIVDVYTGGIPLAFVDNQGIGASIEFLDLDIIYQEASIAHELGHIEYDHINSRRDMERTDYYHIYGTADPQEVEADLFAEDIVGNDVMIQFFDYFIEFCNEHGQKDCHVEAILRKKMLIGRCCV